MLYTKYRAASSKVAPIIEPIRIYLYSLSVSKPVLVAFHTTLEYLLHPPVKRSIHMYKNTLRSSSYD